MADRPKTTQGTSSKEEVETSLQVYNAIREAAVATVLDVIKHAPADKDPGELKATELGQYFDACGAWHEHLTKVLAEAKLTLRSAEKQLTLIEAYLSTVTFAGVKDKDKSAMMSINKDFIDYDVERENASAVVDLLEAQVSAFSRRLQRISRHVTLRVDQQQHAGRLGNVLSAQVGAPPPATRTRK